MRNQTGGKRMSGRTGSAGAKFLLRLLLGWFALASGLVWSAAADAQLLPYRNDIAQIGRVLTAGGSMEIPAKTKSRRKPFAVANCCWQSSGSGIRISGRSGAMVIGAHTAG